MSGGRGWRNWAGNVAVRPAEVVDAGSVAEVRQALDQARRRGQAVRAAGSGHSFSPLAATDGVLLRLGRMRGLSGIDTRGRRVRVHAGTPLHELNPALDRLGLALPDLGDIDRQTVAGALATGTHGTGLTRPGMAAAVSGLRLVLADGTTLWCSAHEEPEIFEAARIGLGALGVVTEVELACVPAFDLHAREAPGDLRRLLDGGALAAAREHDHFELYWFPHTDRVLTKRNDRVAGAGRGPLPAWRLWLEDEVLANAALGALTGLGARRPALAAPLARTGARFLPDREYVDRSWRVFCSRRRLRFVESEYAVPAERGPEVLAALRAWLARHGSDVVLPVELRFAAAEELWLSPAHGRPTAYVAVHHHPRADPRPWFAALEAIAGEHGGRPHWGKLHRLGAAELARLYPRFEDMRRVRDRLDPHRLFRNAHLARVLGD